MTITDQHISANLNKLQVGICLASFLGCIDFTIVNTALPALQREFLQDIGSIQWAMTLFVMALCCCMVMSTRLAERYGAGLVLYSGMLLFGLASLGAGVAHSLTALNLFRLLQGAGCAVLYTVSASILVEAMPAARRGRALGLLFAANGFGLALGPVLGGLLVSWPGWRSIFLVNVPLILLSIYFCSNNLPTSTPRRGTSLDFPGWLMMTAGLVPLLIWAHYVSHWGWLTPTSLGVLLVSLLFLSSFIFVEKRSSNPIIDFSLLRHTRFASACLLTILLAIFYCSAFMLLPFRLKAIYALSGAHLGLLLLPITLVMALISPVAGRLADKFNPWFVLAAGFAALTCSALLLSMTTTQIAQTLVAFVLMGVGWAAILGPSVVAALAGLTSDQHPQGIGLSWTLHNLGGALGLAIASQIYQAGGEVSGFTTVMTGLAVGAFLGTIVAWRNGRRHV